MAGEDDDGEGDVRALWRWGAERGVKWARGARMRNFGSDRGWGVVLGEEDGVEGEVEVGQELVFVGLDLVVHCSAWGATRIGALRPSAGLPKAAVLAIVLLEVLEGAREEYGPWVALLPRTFGTWPFWPEAVGEEFRGAWAAQWRLSAAGSRRRVHADYERVLRWAEAAGSEDEDPVKQRLGELDRAWWRWRGEERGAGRGDGLSYEAYRWADGVVSTRAVFAPEWVSWDERTSARLWALAGAARGCRRGKGRKEEGEGKDPGMLVPLLDMLNHSSENECARDEISREAGGVRFVKTGRALRRGEELLIRYADLPNVDMVAWWGFAVAGGSERDSVRLDADYAWLPDDARRALDAVVWTRVPELAAALAPSEAEGFRIHRHGEMTWQVKTILRLCALVLADPTSSADTILTLAYDDSLPLPSPLARSTLRDLHESLERHILPPEDLRRPLLASDAPFLATLAVLRDDAGRMVAVCVGLAPDVA
jgi:hypothetical protein